MDPGEQVLLAVGEVRMLLQNTSPYVVNCRENAGALHGTAGTATPSTPESLQACPSSPQHWCLPFEVTTPAADLFTIGARPIVPNDEQDDNYEENYHHDDPCHDD